MKREEAYVGLFVFLLAVVALSCAATVAYVLFTFANTFKEIGHVSVPVLW